MLSTNIYLKYVSKKIIVWEVNVSFLPWAQPNTTRSKRSTVKRFVVQQRVIIEWTPFLKENTSSYIWMASCTSGLTHISTIFRRNRAETWGTDKTNKYKLTQKGIKISLTLNVKLVYWSSCCYQWHIFIVLMWVSPLVHNAIHIA